MEHLQAAASSRPALRRLLQEAAQLQACGRCCLRLAGVREAAAYASPALPRTAARVLQELEQHQGSDAEGEMAIEAGEGSKRRRLDPQAGAATSGAAAAGGHQPPADAAEAAADAPGQPPLAAEAGAAGASPAPVCPLCLGLLQSAEVDAAPAAGSGGGGDHGSSQQCCCFQLASTATTLNDPTRFAAAAETAAAQAAPGAAEGLPGAAVPAATCMWWAVAEGNGQARVEQRSAAMPSLAAAAAGIAAEFQIARFALEISLPASLAVRQQALSWRLCGQEQRAAADELKGAVDLREAARLVNCAALAAALGRPHDPASHLCITLKLSHPDAAAECMWLSSNNNGGGGKQRRGRHNWQQQQHQQQQQQAPELPVYSTALLQRLAAMPQADFAARCPPDAARLTASAVGGTVQLQALRKTLHVGGRYLKLRRGIPQSPWFIDGERKGEGSVQDAIERAVLPAFQADSYTLVTAGREDIDVRMLGSGRPFILEIQNARRCIPAPEEFQRMQAAVLQGSGGGVAVHGLHAATASQLGHLKEGEQEKQKSYMAVCWLSRPLTDADVALLGATRELEVQQQTPIRVLHRRANLGRPKVVHEMHAEPLAGRSPHYFALRLRTQAGAYIKEFVHGDLGRSRPSLGDLLGCRAQIVSLDVLEVHMEFGG